MVTDERRRTTASADPLAARHARLARSVRPVRIWTTLLASLMLAACSGGDPEVVQAEDPASQATGAGTGEQAAATEAQAEKSTPRRHVELDAALQARVEAIVAKAVAEAARRQPGKVDANNVAVSVHVRELGADGELVSIGADRLHVPASNVKLVTTAAALVLLGLDWAFETTFEGTGPVEGNSWMQGDLIVRAGGDPLFNTEDPGNAVALLMPVVEKLREAGIHTINGDLILDEGSFLEPGPGPGWPSSDQYWQEHCALSGGFSVNAGSLTAHVMAEKPGQRARVRVVPEGHRALERYRVDTVAAKQPLKISAEARGSRVTVRGEIPADVSHWSTSFSHPDPVVLFGNVLHHVFAGNHIAARFPIRQRDVPRSGGVLAVLRSPMIDLFAPINTDSNNALADQLFFAVGNAVVGQGTREGGLAATRKALEQLGVSHEGLVQVDGSGLSRDNRMSARQFTALLEGVLAGAGAARYRESLAVAGESGTLENRMKSSPARGKVYAKTGWIEGASALSGVVESCGGRDLVFSILVDYPRVGGLNKACWKPMQDELCELLTCPTE